MPSGDSQTSGILLTSGLDSWQKSREEGFVVGRDLDSERHHQLALQYLKEKQFCPESEFVHERDCYYKRNHCHIESRNGARFIRPSLCSKFMLRSGAEIIKEQLQPGNPKQKWWPTYHGTHPSNVKSILEHGLVASGSSAGGTKVAKRHGSALGGGVYTSMIPLYAQIYAHPEKWNGVWVQTFFMLCQHPDTVDKKGSHGVATAPLIDRTDVYKLYGGFVKEDETQFVTSDPSEFCICALMVKINETDPTQPGGELHDVAQLLATLPSS